MIVDVSEIQVAKVEDKQAKKAGTRGWSRQVLAGCPDKTRFQSGKVSKFQGENPFRKPETCLANVETLKLCHLETCF
jgi:hypothetical protein